MENHHFQWENPLYMAIFNSCVKLPEGTIYTRLPLLPDPFMSRYVKFPQRFRRQTDLGLLDADHWLEDCTRQTHMAVSDTSVPTIHS